MTAGHPIPTKEDEIAGAVRVGGLAATHAARPPVLDTHGAVPGMPTAAGAPVLVPLVHDLPCFLGGACSLGIPLPSHGGFPGPSLSPVETRSWHAPHLGRPASCRFAREGWLHQPPPGTAASPSPHIDRGCTSSLTAPVSPQAVAAHSFLWCSPQSSPTSIMRMSPEAISSWIASACAAEILTDMRGSP